MRTRTGIPALIVEDQRTAAFMFLWDSWRPTKRPGAVAKWSEYDAIPSEWTYVDPNQAGIKVHPKLRGDR